MILTVYCSILAPPFFFVFLPYRYLVQRFRILKRSLGRTPGLLVTLESNGHH